VFVSLSEPNLNMLRIARNEQHDCSGFRSTSAAQEACVASALPGDLIESTRMPAILSRDHSRPACPQLGRGAGDGQRQLKLTRHPDPAGPALGGFLHVALQLP
jgi:hypothetical protein